MDIKKLYPILNKESILKTANARELEQAPEDVLGRYNTYALTHIPLGDTTKQLKDLERVIVENKHCAVGTIVGPYGYGKTSTAVHLWNELREQKILAIPPFLWVNLSELMDAVYYWLRFEFSLGPKAFIEPLEQLYENLRKSYKEEIFQKIDPEYAQELIDRGTLTLEIRPADVVSFCQRASELCEQAGYKGMVIFTDELQATLAQYKPSRDEFFAHLFEIVKDILGMEGRWAWVISMDRDTEGTITRLRSDILNRMQRSALYFRVQEMYNRREYPTELWRAFEKRFDFDGKDIISPYALDSIGQVAAREDLGAGPRMVTQALALAIKHYEKTGQAYTPVQFVDDFLAGQLLFDQQGKFSSAVKKALENDQVRKSDSYKDMIKLLAAYPMGCAETTIRNFGYSEAFREFPALARRELIVQMAGGPTLRYLSEELIANENIVQRLTSEFANRFSPGRTYATRAADGFLSHIVIEQAFAGLRTKEQKDVDISGTKYRAILLQGTLDTSYPERLISVLVTALPHSPTPTWEKVFAQADIELRFELNYNVPATEPNRLVVSPTRFDIAVFQLNMMIVNSSEANKIIPKWLFEYYAPERWDSLLCLSLIDHLAKNKVESEQEQRAIANSILQLRQYALLILLGDQLDTVPLEFVSRMVGLDRIRDLVKKQCQQLYPRYRTLITNNKWKDNIQQYKLALQRLIAQNDLSIARGRRPFIATKEEVADTFVIPGRRLTNIEPLLDNLKDFVSKEEFGGRTASSEVTLRFKLHPLEEDLLNQLDTSPEKVRRNGMEVPSAPAELLLRYAKQEGYTDPEITEIIYLLRERKYIDLDQRSNLLTRTVDAVDDLRDALQEQIRVLDEQVRTVAEALPDFDTGLYFTGKLRTQVTESKERDQLEVVKADVRMLSSRLNSFASSRATTLKEKIREKQEELHHLERTGIPLWLRSSFDQGPLSDLLEKQRRDLAYDYQALVENIRLLREDSLGATQSSYSSVIEELVSIHEAQVNLSKQSQKLTTRLKSHQDRQDDFDAWRRVSNMAAETDTEVLNAYHVYNVTQFQDEATQLWTSLRARFEAQPLSFLSSYRMVNKEIEALKKRVTHWLESRREDFDKQCSIYQQLLASANIEVVLRVPFDKERPEESQNALIIRVKEYLEQHFNMLYVTLKNALQVIRYGIQVQGLNLADSELQAHGALRDATIIKEKIRVDIIGDQQLFKDEILKSLISLAETEKKLAEEVQQSVQQRPAKGTELRLMELFQISGTEQEVDLRELIIRLIDQGETSVKLDALIHDIESLFQKNLVDIRIKLSRSKPS